MSKTLKYQDDKVDGYNDAMQREFKVVGAEHRKELVDFIVKFQSRFLFAALATASIVIAGALTKVQWGTRSHETFRHVTHRSLSVPVFNPQPRIPVNIPRNHAGQTKDFKT